MRHKGELVFIRLLFHRLATTVGCCPIYGISIRAFHPNLVPILAHVHVFTRRGRCCFLTQYSIPVEVEGSILIPLPVKVVRISFPLRVRHIPRQTRTPTPFSEQNVEFAVFPVAAPSKLRFLYLGDVGITFEASLSRTYLHSNQYTPLSLANCSTSTMDDTGWFMLIGLKTLIHKAPRRF